jgi:glucoside 3-dehydrogenase (cytochrome c) hitch-hiker subunit
VSKEQSLVGRLTRRKALKKIAGTAGAAMAFPMLSSGAPVRAAHLSAPLRLASDRTSYAPKWFNPDQMETIAALAETIIPADEHSPGARAARVHEFIDTMIAESQQTRKAEWAMGLAAVDRRAKSEYQNAFAQCPPEQQSALLQKISANEADPKTAEERFFITIKNATIEGYYTSAIGIHQELEYQGNTALGEFEGCTLRLPARPTK